jgi:arylsulfatase A-like enzyme
MRGPGVAAGRRVRQPVANLDLVPTLLDYAGVAVDGSELDGQSLRPLAASDGNSSLFPEPRYVFSAQDRFQSVTDGRLKLIMDIETSEAALFDLSEDPGERTNLAGERSEQVARLSGALHEWAAQASGRASNAERLRNADAVQERLRALGYLP